MITLAHLLDDFGMGGVTRALALFDEPELAGLAQSRVVPISPDARIAPALDADIIVDHMALSWARLAFLASLRARNPKARIIHIEHSYTRSFEAEQVNGSGRFRFMLRLAASLVDQIVCVSKAQRDWLQGPVGVASAKLRVIYPWCGRADLLNLPASAPRGDRALRLLAYGRYAKVKNFAELVTAMRSFEGSEVKLRVFGDGPERSLLKALAAD